MSKVLVIPDVHLKPHMINKAEMIVFNGCFDEVVFLGDIVDDWGREMNLDLYQETIDRVVDFINQHPNTSYIYGNHDVSYLWGKLESGYSVYAIDVVKKGMNKLTDVLAFEKIGYIKLIDNVIFSHAGLTASFVLEHFGTCGSDLGYIIDNINNMEAENLWKDNSPIWARPQDGAMRIYPPNYLQVVGHTPVSEPLLEGNLLSVDTFSTYSDGTPIGDCRFICVDTVDKTWAYAE